MSTKACNKCERVLTLDRFNKDPRNKDGLQGICEDCRRAAKQAARAKRMAGEGIVHVENKTCNKCKQTKSVSEFYKDAGLSDGRSTVCKICRAKSSQNWRVNNREHYNAKMREYNKKHYSRLRIQRYDLTVEEYDAMLKAQEGRCKICDSHPKGVRPLAIDHCHDSNKVRGLLCYGCNRAIAILDRPELLKKAMIYLAKD